MPGGTTVVLNGTVEEVYSELVKINPSYTLDFGLEDEAREEGEEEEEEEGKEDSDSELTKRYDVKCNHLPRVPQKFVKRGISYLHGVPGKPRNGPGPGNCGRVSCGYSAAIWWCNDVSSNLVTE